MAFNDPAPASRLTRRAATAGLSLAIGLCLLKAAAVLATGSLALLATLIDGLADVAASTITYLSVKISARPPDQAHRFGHGKAESLSALTQAALVGGSAVFVVVDAGRRLLRPETVERPVFGLAVVALSVALTLLLVLYQRSVVRRTGSLAIAADSLHYQADVLTNLAVGLSLFLTWRSNLAWADPLAAAFIALWLFWHALVIGRRAIDQLMDKEMPADERRLIDGIVRRHPGVVDMHDLRTRTAGSTAFIEMHLELPPSMSLARAHAITDEVEARLRDAFPQAEIVVHQEPAGIDDARLDHAIASGNP